MDAAQGVEEWAPQATEHALFERTSCVGTVVTPIDCGNGVCCPLGSTCIPGANGSTSCKGSALGVTAEVPGLTVSAPTAGVATVPSTVSTPSSSSVSTQQTGVSTLEASTVTQTVTASPISTATAMAIPSPSPELSSSSLSSISLIFATSTQRPGVSPGVSSGDESLTTSLMVAAPTMTMMASTSGQNANAGTGNIGSSTITTPFGAINIGTAAAIAIGVGAVGFIFIVLLSVCCVRLRRRKAKANQPRASRSAASDTSDTERGTPTLPRGGSTTFSDVVEARRYDEQAPSRASTGSNPFVDRPPEMTAIDQRGEPKDLERRSYERGSYDNRSRDSRSQDGSFDDSVYDLAIASLQSDMNWQSSGSEAISRVDSISTARTSRSVYQQEDTQRRDESPPRRLSIRDDELRQSVRRSQDYQEAEDLDIPEPAALFLRDPFSSPEPRPLSPLRPHRRATSPKRYLYPETDRDPQQNEEDERPESRGISDSSQRQPMNYLPVFQPPTFAILPGTSGTIVEMI